MENLDKTIERGAKIEVTKDRADSLIDTSTMYMKKSRQVREQQRRRRIIMIVSAIVCISIILVALIILSLIHI